MRPVAADDAPAAVFDEQVGGLGVIRVGPAEATASAAPRAATTTSRRGRRRACGTAWSACGTRSESAATAGVAATGERDVIEHGIRTGHPENRRGARIGTAGADTDGADDVPTAFGSGNHANRITFARKVRRTIRHRDLG